MSARELLVDVYTAAVGAVHAGRAVEKTLRARDPGGLQTVLGAGKAACAMARGALDALGRRVSGGLVVTKDGHSFPVPPLEVLEASHPVPDARSVEAAERALHLAHSLGPSDALLLLISGGASALWCAPARDVRLEEKQLVTQALLNAGAEIGEINTVRKHLSRIKGGRLLAAAQPATVLTLAVSDVAGDLPDRIGSGPTVLDPTTFAEALAVLRNRGVDVSPAVRRHLESGAARERENPGSLPSGESEFLVVAGLGDALEAARVHAKSLGQPVRLLGPTLYGEARVLARSLAERARHLREEGGGFLIAGGEPTVRVRGPGAGGRCQELALAFAMELDGAEGITALFAGTDGSDGPTDAAGAFADAGTVARARANALDPTSHLERNDSYPLLRAAGDLYITGPTQTNVTDLALIHISPRFR